MEGVKLFREETLQILSDGENDEKDRDKIEEKSLIVEQIFTNCDTGSVVWDAGLVLLDFIKNFRSMFMGQRILELGSGTGYVGIGSLLLGAEFVLLTDQEKQLPLLKRNVERNIHRKQSVEVLPLNWDSQNDLQLVVKRIQDEYDTAPSSSEKNGESPLNWIIGSDLVYGKDFRENLAHLLTNLLKTFPSATILISHEQRARSQLEIDTNRDFSREFFSYMKEGPNDLKGRLNVETVPKLVLEGRDCMHCDEIKLWMIRFNDEEDNEST